MTQHTDTVVMPNTSRDAQQLVTKTGAWKSPTEIDCDVRSCGPEGETNKQTHVMLARSITLKTLI